MGFFIFLSLIFLPIRPHPLLNYHDFVIQAAPVDTCINFRRE
jgi:hypothetical protein